MPDAIISVTFVNIIIAGRKFAGMYVQNIMGVHIRFIIDR